MKRLDALSIISKIGFLTISRDTPTKRCGKKKSGGLWFAYEGDGEGPSVKYSDDGYWKLVDGDWIPTEKQLSAINDGAVVEEIKPQS